MSKRGALCAKLNEDNSTGVSPGATTAINIIRLIYHLLHVVFLNDAMFRVLLYH